MNSNWSCSLETLNLGQNWWFLLSHVTSKFDGGPWKKTGHLFYTTSSYVHHFNAIGKFRRKWQSGNTQFAWKPDTFFPCDLEIWRMTLKNNRAPLPCNFKLCTSFHSHLWVQTGFTFRKPPNLGQNRRFLVPCDIEIWQMTLKNNRAPLLCYFKPCGSFHPHMWNQTGVTVRIRLNWILTSVTLTFDLWHFAWTSLLSLVITPENFMMIRSWEHSEKSVTDRQTDRQTDRRKDGRAEVFIELLGSTITQNYSQQSLKT